jgi:hypothetical protein
VTPRTPGTSTRPLVRAVARAAAALVLAAAIAACGTSSGTPIPTAAATSQAAAASDPASAPASAPASDVPASLPPETPEPSVDSHGVPELEALLPASVGGIALERLSLTGADFYALGTSDSRARLDDMLKGLGRTLADLAVADAGDPTGKAVLEVGALRVAGAEPARLLSEWVASNQAVKPGQIVVTAEALDGRRLTKLVDSTRPVGGSTYAYAIGDTIFLVAADDPAILSSALAQLPKP